MITVEVVQTERVLTEMKEAWTNLLAEVPDVSIFLTWEWITTWWHYYGQDKTLYLLVARDGAGALTGIAPLMLAKTGWGPLALRRLLFIGTGIAYPAHLDIIARPEDRQLVVRALLAALRERKDEWDLLELVSLSETSPLKTDLASLGGQSDQGYSMPCPYVTLPDNWHAYEMNYLSSNMRQQLKRARRQLEKDFPNQVVFEHPTQADQVTAAVRQLAFLSQRRWHEEDTRSAFDESHTSDFTLELALVALKQDWLRFSVLKVGEETAAVSYCLRYGNIVYNYQNAFSLEWSKYSPGRLMMAHVIEAAIQEGAHEFDMLHGNVGAKDRWKPSVRADQRLRIGHGLRGGVSLIGTAFFDDAVQFGRKHLPESVRQRASYLLPQTQW